MTDTKPTPYAWTVTGTAQIFFGPDAQYDAENLANCCGVNTRAFPLFAEEPVAQKAPTSAYLEDIAKNPELYEDYAPGRTSLEYLSPALFGRAVLARFGAAPQAPAQTAQPIGYIHPRNMNRLAQGEAVAIRKNGWNGEPEQVPVFFQPAAPAMPSRQPMTDDKVYESIKGVDSLDALAVWRAAEAAHGITEKK